MQEHSNSECLALHAEHVSFAYEPSTWILNDVSLVCKRSACIGLVGKNGSGKTTLGKLLAGILSPNLGLIRVDQTQIGLLRLGQIGQLIGYLFQEPEKQLFAASVIEEITFPLTLQGIDEKESTSLGQRLLQKFSLEHLASAPPYRLSRGEKQRLALAAIFVNQPGFLILDEPTTALDAIHKQELGELLMRLNSQGMGIIIISHDLKFLATYVSETYTIAEGSIYRER